MAQIPKLMARLQSGLQFNTVPRRPGQTDQGRWASLTDPDSDDPSRRPGTRRTARKYSNVPAQPPAVTTGSTLS
jgi:hypothetical protein